MPKPTTPTSNGLRFEPLVSFTQRWARRIAAFGLSSTSTGVESAFVEHVRVPLPRIGPQLSRDSFRHWTRCKR